MKRRTFISTSASVFAGAAVSTTTSNGALGAKYNLDVPDVIIEPEESIDLKISFSKLNLNPIGIDTSKDLKMRVKVALDNNELVTVDEKSYAGSNITAGEDISSVVNSNKPNITNNPSEGTNPVRKAIDEKTSYEQLDRELNVQLIFAWDSVTARSQREVSTLTIRRETLPNTSDVTEDFTVKEESFSLNKPTVSVQVQTENLNTDSDLSSSDLRVGERVGSGDFREVEVTDFSLSGQTEDLAPDVVLVIDGSGSMDGKLSNAQSAARSLVDKLGDKVQIGVIEFTNSATTRQTLTTNHSAAKSAINEINASGGTDMTSGMIQGGSELENRARQDSRNFVIGICDGDVNYSYSSGDYPDNTGVMGISYGSGADDVSGVVSNQDYAYSGGTNAIDDIFTQISEVIDSFYSINYEVNDTETTGTRDYRVYFDQNGTESVLTNSYDY